MLVSCGCRLGTLDAMPKDIVRSFNFVIKILKGLVGGNIAGVASKNGEVVVEVGMFKAR